MKNTIITIIILSFLLSGPVGADQGKETLKTKKAVIIIAKEKFRDEEFKAPYELLKKHGVTIKQCILYGSPKSKTGS